ncbi:MAG TPA: 2,3-bisphosphoglycerate-independent phosphoglycerate mutase [Armatimonadota bacterium]|nr:2,3-bisphosphoglycerate-independent phosphoglycerate mutase [Armatimonadota bacterium]
MAELGKAVIIIGDGMGDLPVPALNDDTPIEAANKPNLDRLAREGESGLMDPIAPGVRAGSDTAHLAILGFDPFTYYTGRGPFEAAGIGMDVRPGDICFRVNFATVDEQMRVIDRRAGRISAGTDQLAAALNGLTHNGCTFYFKESVAHRAALVIRGDDLGPHVTDADPHVEGGKVHLAHGEDADSQKTADMVNWFVQQSYEILKEHPVNKTREQNAERPANIALPRGAGGAPDLPPFEKSYGFTGALVVEVGLVKGIGKYLGMDVIDVPEATGDLRTDEIAMAKTVIDALDKHPFVLCNLKSPDVAGHDSQPDAKVTAIEKLDRLVGYILEHCPENTYITVSADHSTPIVVGDHTGEPVPIVIWGKNVRTDQVEIYGERPSAQGSVGRIRGKDIMRILTSYTLRQEKFGA